MQPKGSLPSLEALHHWPLPWAKWIHSTPNLLNLLRSILVLYLYLHLTSKYSLCTPVFLSTNEASVESLLELVTEWNTHSELDSTQVCILICRIKLSFTWDLRLSWQWILHVFWSVMVFGLVERYQSFLPWSWSHSVSPKCAVEHSY
jgi:hypothetical protein